MDFFDNNKFVLRITSFENFATFVEVANILFEIIKKIVFILGAN